MYVRIKSTAGKEAIIVLASTTGLDKSKAIKKLSNGQAFQVSSSFDLQGIVEMKVKDVSSKLVAMMKDVSAKFVGRDELVEAFTLGLVAGEHTFVLSPPGTAKTAVAGALTECISGKLWRTLMNPDLTRDGLVGMIDPFAFQEGRWERQWSGIATCDVAIIDEVWKGSGQNNNILLDVLEERKIREGDRELAIPLLSALAMSNEIPDDSERQAIYDRFLIRLTIGYMKDVDQFGEMLIASAATDSQVKEFVSINELRLIAAAAELIALAPPQSLIDGIKELWREIGVNGHGISDRRWRKTLKLACAYALMKGRKPSAADIVVAKWTLWQEPDEEAEIRKLVYSRCDPFANDALNIEALYEDLLKQSKSLTRTNLEEMAEFTGSAGKLLNLSSELAEKMGENRHRDKIEVIFKETNQLMTSVIRGQI